MYDYWCFNPLWSETDAEFVYVADDELREELLESGQFFCDHFHWEYGWPTQQHHDEHFSRAQALLPKLQAYFADKDVYHDVWETNVKKDGSDPTDGTDADAYPPAN